MLDKVNNQNNIAAKQTDTKKKINKRSIIGSIVGVSVGLAASIALTKKSMPIKDVFVKNDLSKTFKNLYDYTKVDYEGFRGFLAMTMQAAGAAFGSLIAASTVKDDSEHADKEKKSKLKEAIFMTNNVVIPTAFVKTIEYLYEKNLDAVEAKKKLKEFKNSASDINIGKLQSLLTNKYLKAAGIALALVGGMMASLSVTNTINNKYIEKEDSVNKKMRPLDFIYHVDDIIPIIISSKIPICEKLPIDRVLPLIYGFMGSKVGSDEGHQH